MTKFGIHSIEQLPDKRKRRRLFSFSDTLGNDKEILVKLLNEKLGDYCPKEVPVPKISKMSIIFLTNGTLVFSIKPSKNF